MEFQEAFDIVTLIFYDFCVLNIEEQKFSRKNIQVVKTDGVFICDVFSKTEQVRLNKYHSLHEDSGVLLHTLKFYKLIYTRTPKPKECNIRLLMKMAPPGS